jgi:hypothetical protein
MQTVYIHARERERLTYPTSDMFSSVQSGKTSSRPTKEEEETNKSSASDNDDDEEEKEEETKKSSASDSDDDKEEASSSSDSDDDEEEETTKKCSSDNDDEEEEEEGKGPTTTAAVTAMLELVSGTFKESEERMMSKIEGSFQEVISMIKGMEKRLMAEMKKKGASAASAKATSAGTTSSKPEVPVCTKVMVGGKMMDYVTFGSGSKEEMRKLCNESTLDRCVVLAQKKKGESEAVNLRFPTVTHALVSRLVRNRSIFSTEGLLGGDPLKACIAVYGEEKGPEKCEYFCKMYKCFGAVAKQAYLDATKRKNNVEAAYKLDLLDGVDTDKIMKLMETILRAKFHKNPDHRNALLGTGSDIYLVHVSRGSSNKVLVQDDVFDMLCGSVCKTTGKLTGENKLGLMLMDIRKELAKGKSKKAKQQEEEEGGGGSSSSKKKRKQAEEEEEEEEEDASSKKAKKKKQQQEEKEEDEDI